MEDNTIQPVPTIRMTVKTAAFIVAEVRKLWRAGSGNELYGTDDSDSGVGLMEDIPFESPTFMWAQHMLVFLRFISGVLEQELENNIEDD